MIIKKFFTILFSIIIALFLCEFIYSFLDKNTKKYNQILNIYSLWSDKNKTGGRKNIEGKIWTYDENNEFFTSLYIYKNNKWIKEFEYTHNSNNFGLNQINDISLKKKSIIFLTFLYLNGALNYINCPCILSMLLFHYFELDFLC